VIEKMMVVGVCGSPKKGGNTEFLLGEALAVAGERGFDTQRLLISEMKVDFCNDCGDCSKGRPCPKEDDAAAILSSLERADGIIIASPVYFGSVTAQLKAVFDRTIPLRRQGSRNGGQEKTLETVHAWMHIHGMIVVGDDSHFGGIAVRPAAEDRIGRKTVVASANKLCDLLERLEKQKSCWGGD
jgi:multimeric flavodoxin WrbA